MPELPEVETVARELRPLLAQRRITECRVFWDKSFVNKAALPVKGQSIGTLWRKGKYLIIPLERSALIIHLRMSGQLLLVPKDDPLRLKHVRVRFMLDNGLTLYFNDTRKFGRIYHVTESDEILNSVGIDAMDSAFTPGYFLRGLKKKRYEYQSPAFIAAFGIRVG